MFHLCMWGRRVYLVVTSALKHHECGCEDIAMSDALRGFVPFQVYLFPLTTWVSCLTGCAGPMSGHNAEVSIPGQSLLNRPYPPEL